MKLSYAIESIVVFAVGLGLARWHLLDPVYSVGYAQLTTALWIKEAGNGFFAGAALVGILGLTIEVAWRRTPQPWGPGRWAWGVVGLFLLSRQILDYISIAYLYRSRGLPLANFVDQLVPEARANLCVSLMDIAPYILIAVGLSRPFSGTAATVSDGREWAGRLFATLIVITGVLVNILSAGS